ncbi:MAG: putative metal-dependent hydrolase [Ferruginibacter sp.]|nr:putative metal-dependent hydrolase [Ferruginibacter sp.]
MDDLRYPIDRYIEQAFTHDLLKEWLLDIQYLPHHLENALLNLDENQIDTPYREGGWSIRQLVHHVADSHMNAYIRFKLGLSEENPSIKPYNQDAWAQMPDTKNIPVNISVTLLFALHRRWIELLNNVQPNEWERTLFHPEYKKTMSLWYVLGLYAWHSRHHVAQITSLRKRMGWN